MAGRLWVERTGPNGTDERRLASRSGFSLLTFRHAASPPRTAERHGADFSARSGQTADSRLGATGADAAGSEGLRVHAVRIHLARMSPLLRRMITDLLAPEADIEIVGAADGSGESLVAARAEGANVIITQGNGGTGDACLAAIVDSSPLTILNIAPSGSAGTSINLLRRNHSLDAARGSSLAQVVRNAVEQS